MEFRRGPCVCGLASCGTKCECGCHAYDAFSCVAILSGVKYYFPRICVADLAGVSRNELFRWMQQNVRELHEHLPSYLEHTGLADDEVSEEEYMLVPDDIALRMGELEEGGRNVPEKRRGSPSPTPSVLKFYKPPATSLCTAFNLSPQVVLSRASADVKACIDPMFAKSAISKKHRGALRVKQCKARS